MKSHAITVHAVGGPEQLTWGEVDVAPPGPGEVLLEQAAVGLNFIDVYMRTGLYPRPLPFVPGQEAAGTVREVGPDVTSLGPGDRVAYAGVVGAYARHRTIAADRLVKLPEAVSAELAASLMLKGMTAEYLLRRCAPVRSGDTIVIHAAAGGVGQLVVPWARHLGATVVGIVGSDEKAAVARERGAHHVFLQSEPWPDRVRELTGGRGADTVYDSVGKDTLKASLDCLRVRGTLVSFGQSSGKAPPLDLVADLGGKSLFLSRPSLGAYTASRAELEESARALFAVVTGGVVRPARPTTYRLEEAAAAHRALESRQTTGSVVLLT